MPNTTPNYQLYLPLVNDPTDQDLWGGYLNANFTSLDTIIHAIAFLGLRTATTTDAITSADRGFVVEVDGTAGTFIESLPAASSVPSGFPVTVSRVDAIVANTVNVQANGADKIGGSSTPFALAHQADFISLVSDGVSNWIISARSFQSIPTATTTTPGIVQLATAAQAKAATDAADALTPATATAHPGSVKAWGLINGTTGALIAGYNIASVTKQSTGHLTVNLTSPMDGINYAPMVCTQGTDAVMGTVPTIASASQFTLTTFKSTTGVAEDVPVIYVHVCGNQP